MEGLVRLLGVSFELVHRIDQQVKSDDTVFGHVRNGFFGCTVFLDESPITRRALFRLKVICNDGFSIDALMG